MLTKYDPGCAPDPARWLALDEGERIELVRRYHRRERIRVPNERLHAAAHAVVETQIAMGDATPAAATLQRLMAEGLDRHDAVHAIGSVLMRHLWRVMDDDDIPEDQIEPVYFAELEAFSAQKWYDEYREESGGDAPADGGPEGSPRIH